VRGDGVREGGGVGLDVYVGSLTRYYVEGSADVVDRIARRQGLPVDDGQDAEEVIRTAVVRWRDRLSSWPSPRSWPPTGARCRPRPATAWPCCGAWPSGRSSTGSR
jgi:hypothetical protein